MEGDSVASSRFTKNSKAKNLTASELSKYFSQKRSPEELHSVVTSQRRSALQSGHADKRQKYIKRVVDHNNRRYAASQASSMLGGLTTGQHAKNSFYIAGGSKDDKVFGQRIPCEDIIDPKNATREEIEGQLTDIGLNKDPDTEAVAQDELDLMKTVEGEDANSADEMTCYMDSESVFMQMLKEKTGAPADDAATVASSAVDAMSVYSGVPTTYYSKKYEHYNEQLNREKEKRLVIENQINKIKEQMLK